MRARGEGAVTEGLERALARTLATTAVDGLPEAVLATTRLFTLDTVGVIAGARRAPGIPELNAALARWESDGKATALAGGFRASPPTAALLNGAAAHALEFDDQHDPARIHAFSVVLPAALAAAEAEGGVAGRDFLAALAIGVELFCRLGLAAYNSLGKGWHPTTMLGGLAGAAAAGRVLGLDEERMLNALALAYAQFCGTTQVIFDGALAKRIGPGFAARNAVLAAHLARGGITGPVRFLTGKAGLIAQYERGEFAADALLDGLGQDWRILDLSMKPYPSCRCLHTVITVALELHREGVRAGDLKSVEIGLGEVNHAIVGAPFDPENANPAVHAQFNARYGFARALADGRVGIASFQPEKVLAPDVELARRTACVVAADIEPTATEPARLRLVFRDGTERRIVRDTMKGSPAEPMTEAEARDKFRACVAWGFGAGEAAADRLAERILALDQAPDAAVIARAFAELAPAPVSDRLAAAR